MHSTSPSSSGDATPGIDITKPSIARGYDAALNGKDNYEVDRELLRQILLVAPEATQIAWDNRMFLIRLVRFLAYEAGITQFLDCGSGLPTAENTHQIAQRIQREARVVYVDNDPVVVAYGRALLQDNDQTHLIDADIFEPRHILDNETVRKHLDFSEPIALLQNGTLHHYNGTRSPADLMREYIDALPAGSYVGISHFLDPETSEYSPLARRIEQVFLRSPLGCGWFRTRTEIQAMFCGLELLEPGLTLCAQWWPDGPQLTPLHPVQHCIAGGVGRKP
ncbi:MAG: SAM-dependent methyltransferase [Pseudonocardiaceae bacterium]